MGDKEKTLRGRKRDKRRENGKWRRAGRREKGEDRREMR